MANSSDIWLCEFLLTSTESDTSSAQSGHGQIEYLSNTTDLGPTANPVSGDNNGWDWSLIITQIIIYTLDM